ncbi:glutamate synthase, small subunit [Campylobacter mucosalis]|uniref:glutamate synthase subunit beta n=1 Tax=Campylobacter mucosalis TaxID=202 RepID=UPI0015938D4F|nr:glutamate synthase subunit beta [Campylobacter mucosalis]QKF63565.1 glutamate synthase, small subunit [Campylobacter mucosalis]
MQEFVNLGRGEALKRDAFVRICDFKEIYELLDKDVAKEQSSRCIGCANPFCHSKCPLGNFIPFWLRSNASENLEQAFKISNETNPFPEITGRVCPQDRLCEGACTLNDGYGAVMIGPIETFITEEGLKRGYKLICDTPKMDKKVAIIGSGPAGISAATYLLRAGVDVSMYEADDLPGGLLRYGIPGFKLDKSIVDRRFEILKEAGLKIFTNCEVGKDIEFDDVANSHDALFVAIGARKAKKANILNEDALGCFEALDFLTAIQKGVDIGLKDKKILVIGGGDTAMDCVRSAVRCGAKEVLCAYRRDKSSMGGSKKEFINADEEGVKFIFNASPKEVRVNDNGEVVGVIAQKTSLNAKKLDIIKNSEFNIACDIVVFALGFSVLAPKFLVENGVELSENGQIVVDRQFQSKSCGIYAGGDCVSGADLVVSAANDGKMAAKAIISSFL